MTAPRDTMHQPAHPADGAGQYDPAIRDDALRGLLATPKTLPPKLFYDAVGARLFERICELPEYYPTRTELAILEDAVPEIAALAGPAATLVEYGSGAGQKVRLLLEALDAPAGYVPIDISAEQLRRVASDIAADYPAIRVQPLAADYTRPLTLPAVPAERRRIAFFPGSTIGNFHPAEATAFLRRIRRSVGSAGALILGVDRMKDPAVLHAAYDDAAGVTAAFNRNVLRRLNRELDADFALDTFEHLARVNVAAHRVEMHLVSLCAQTVHVAGVPIHFEAGESIWTESSYKYDEALLREVTEGAGFRCEQLWTDEASRFWVGFFAAV